MIEERYTMIEKSHIINKAKESISLGNSSFIFRGKEYTIGLRVGSVRDGNRDSVATYWLNGRPINNENKPHSNNVIWFSILPITKKSNDVCRNCLQFLMGESSNSNNDCSVTWLHFLNDNSYMYDPSMLWYYVIIPAEKIYKIDSISTFHEFENSGYLSEDHKEIDFEKIAKDGYSGFSISNYSDFSFFRRRPFNSWDCDSTVIWGEELYSFVLTKSEKHAIISSLRLENIQEKEEEFAIKIEESHNKLKSKYNVCKTCNEVYFYRKKDCKKLIGHCLTCWHKEEKRSSRPMWVNYYLGNFYDISTLQVDKNTGKIIKNIVKFEPHIDI